MIAGWSLVPVGEAGHAWAMETTEGLRGVAEAMRSRFGRGDFFGLLTRIPLDRALRFEQGGVAGMDDGQLAAESVLSPLLSSARHVVVQDVWAEPGDINAPGLPTGSAGTDGSVYHSAQADGEPLGRCLSFLSLTFVAPAAHFLDGARVRPEHMLRAARTTPVILLSAYDQESFLVWKAPGSA